MAPRQRIVLALVLQALSASALVRTVEEKPARHRKRDNEVAAVAMNESQLVDQRHMLAAKRRMEAKKAEVERQEAAKESKAASEQETEQRHKAAQEIREAEAAQVKSHAEAAQSARAAEAQRVKAREDAMHQEQVDRARKVEVREAEKKKEAEAELKSKEEHVAQKRREAAIETRSVNEKLSGLAKMEAREKAREKKRFIEEIRYAARKAKRERLLEEDRLTIKRRQDQRFSDKEMRVKEREQQAHLKAQREEEHMKRAVELAREREEFQFASHILRAAKSQRKEAQDDVIEVKKGTIPDVRLGNLTKSTLKSTMAGFVATAKSGDFLKAITEATLTSQASLTKYVIGLRRKTTDLLNASADANERHFIAMLQTFFEEAQQRSNEQAKEPALIAKAVKTALPSAVGARLSPIITLMTPSMALPNLHTEGWRNATNGEACGVLAINKARLMQFNANTLRVHEALNATAKTLPLLSLVDATFNRDVIAVANNLLHLGYMQVISIEEVAADIKKRLHPVLLNKIHCASHW